MENYTTSKDLEMYNYFSCRHLKQKRTNIFLDCLNDSFYKLNYNKQIHQNFDYSYQSDYFLRNLGVEWIAVSSFNNINYNLPKEGCIFSLTFDHSSSLMAASNRI